MRTEIVVRGLGWCTWGKSLCDGGFEDTADLFYPHIKNAYMTGNKCIYRQADSSQI